MICLQPVVPAAILYPHTDRIEIVGGLQIQVGGDSRGDLALGLGGDLVGDSVGCFQFGDADVTIWGGLDGVVALVLPAVPEVLWGPFLV